MVREGVPPIVLEAFVAIPPEGNDAVTITICRITERCKYDPLKSGAPVYPVVDVMLRRQIQIETTEARAGSI